MSEETTRLLALLDSAQAAPILRNVEEIAAEMRWLASKWGAVDRENSALALAYADVREAAEAYQVALAETVQRATGDYDWNADPDRITLMQGNAAALLARCTRSRDVLTSQQREAALLDDRDRLAARIAALAAAAEQAQSERAYLVSQLARYADDKNWLPTRAGDVWYLGGNYGNGYDVARYALEAVNESAALRGGAEGAAGE